MYLRVHSIQLYSSSTLGLKPLVKTFMNLSTRKNLSYTKDSATYIGVQNILDIRAACQLPDNIGDSCKQ